MDEVEAKFILPSRESGQQLQEIDRLGDYALGPVQVEAIQDTFLDTAERAILSANFYCRQREYAGQAGVWVTLKALGGGEGALHRREELQMPLASALPPADWPDGPLRERVLGWIGAAELAPLVRLEQVRRVRPVLRAGQPVAALSVDEVRLLAGRRQESFQELEVELTASGSEEDLAAITAALQSNWRLLPQERSKFERALAFLEQGPPGLLSPGERAACEALAARGDLHGRRARALLALDAGETQEEAGRHSGISARRVRYWQAAFREKRLKIFPDRVLAATLHEQKNDRQGVPATPRAPEAVEIDGSPQGHRPAALPDWLPPPGKLDAEDTMAQAARKTLGRHARRMLENEVGARLGEDMEAVHDMRVATRRMRAALRVFGAYLDADQEAALTQSLRRAGRVLGVVRDMDVFRDKALRYLDGRPEAERSGFAPFLAAWESNYRHAREALVGYLDGERYARLKELLAAFLQEPEREQALASGAEPRPHRLRQVVPVALYQGLAAVRAYDEWLAAPDVPLERYHQLRIAGKRLRYALEFFRDVLDPAAGLLVDEVKALQDHLGDLQDAVVACGLLRDFLVWGTWGRPAKDAAWPAAPIVAPGVAAYLAFRQAEIQRLVETFPATWAPIRGPEFGQLLAQCIAVLL